MDGTSSRITRQKVVVRSSFFLGDLKVVFSCGLGVIQEKCQFDINCGISLSLVVWPNRSLNIEADWQSTSLQQNKQLFMITICYMISCLHCHMSCNSSLDHIAYQWRLKTLGLFCVHMWYYVTCQWLLMLMEGFPVSGLREINLLLNLRHDNIVPLTEIVVGKRLDRFLMSTLLSLYFTWFSWLSANLLYSLYRW